MEVEMKISKEVTYKQPPMFAFLGYKDREKVLFWPQEKLCLGLEQMKAIVAEMEKMNA
jgi:hypothetical protein